MERVSNSHILQTAHPGHLTLRRAFEEGASHLHFRDEETWGQRRVCDLPQHRPLRLPAELGFKPRRWGGVALVFFKL